MGNLEKELNKIATEIKSFDLKTPDISNKLELLTSGIKYQEQHSKRYCIYRFYTLCDTSLLSEDVKVLYTEISNEYKEINSILSDFNNVPEELKSKLLSIG